MRGFPALTVFLGLVLISTDPAAAQQKPALKRVTLSALTAQGFEVKAVIRDSIVLQKGAEVYSCSLRVADTSPLSYQSDCFAVR